MRAAIRDGVNASALVAAVLAGDAARVTSVLANGADPNEVNDEGWTPLMFAALGSEVAIVDQLVLAGADLNRQARDGSTPLMKAVLWQNIAIVTALLGHGADPTVQDAWGWTAASVAAAQGDRELVKRLTAARR
jgi:ankyrin repeat protein